MELIQKKLDSLTQQKTTKAHIFDVFFRGPCPACFIKIQKLLLFPKKTRETNTKTVSKNYRHYLHKTNILIIPL